MESMGTRRDEMRTSSGWRICIVGTGGQGVLTAARLLCDTFVERGHDVVSGQLHGMAQRGGGVCLAAAWKIDRLHAAKFVSETVKAGEYTVNLAASDGYRNPTKNDPG